MVYHLRTVRKILLSITIIGIGIKAHSQNFIASKSTKNIASHTKKAALTVTGKVTSSETQEPLPGVAVVIRGTTTGTVTDQNGKYALIVGSDQDTLSFSFIGYLTEEVPIAKRTEINVALVADILSLQEIVVIGYGTQTKEDLTGSIVSVSKENFNKGQNISPEQLIAGKIAGVQITSNGGAPGSGSQIRIRGGASLNATNDPLIVIDGVPLDNSSITGSSNPLSLISPDDIENITVLKDASATAIYGSRASNGVIIITTKKGKDGDKFKVNFNSLVSISELPKTVRVLNADEYRYVVNGVSPTNARLLGNANTDWQDLIYRTAVTHDHNLNLTGATRFSPYRLSFGYLNQNGILKTSNMQRMSSSLNLNPEFMEGHLKINLNVKGIVTDSRFADESAIGAAVNMDPTQPVYAESPFGGYFEWTDINFAPKNPVSILEQTRDKGHTARSIGNLQADYRFHFFPDLRANVNIGYDVSKGERNTFRPRTLASVYAVGGNKVDFSQTKTNKLFDFYLNYVKVLESIHSKIDVMAGYSYQDFIRDEPAYNILNLEGRVLEARNPFKTQSTLVSFFGRLNYTFLDRYLLTATVRQDGSSRFSPDNRWGTFPSLALAWKLKNEAFLKNAEAVSDLKLRVGYGVTGQQDLSSYGDLGDYPYLARYTVGDNTVKYQFGNTFYSTYRPQAFDSNIKWEETHTYNAGIDFGFLNGRVSGSIDYYFKKTKDLLSEVPTAVGSNFSNSLITNVGNIENKGLELALNFKLISKENMTWNVGINGAYNKNKVTNLSKHDSLSIEVFSSNRVAGATDAHVQINSVGYPVNSFYVFKQVYNENGNPIEGLYADLNNDGVINEKDMYKYKSPAPVVTLGFNSQFTYKKWSAGFVMRASFGNYVYNNTKANAVYNNVKWGNYLLNIPRVIGTTNFVGDDSNRLFSDLWVENASFLRMDNINVGYNFGNVYKDKVTLSLNANAQNVFVITKFSGLDPEETSGISNNLYPRPRVFSAGFSLGF